MLAIMTVVPREEMVADLIPPRVFAGVNVSPRVFIMEHLAQRYYFTVIVSVTS